MENQNKPITQVLLKHKTNQNVQEFATMLEIIAKKLREDQQFTLMQGDEHVEVTPSNELKVEFEYTVKGDKHSFEIEFDWYTGKEAKQTMKIK